MIDFQFLIYVIPIIFAITLHEAGHAFVANIFGDNSAKLMGRLSLNPIKHIDPIGTVLIPASLVILSAGFIFGWAKPVMINTRALRSPKRDMIWIAFAGPAANILMAIFWVILFKISHNSNMEILSKMSAVGIWINLLLAIFNLLPIPPLDGSRILSSLMPYTISYQYNKLERYGFFIIIALMLLTPFGGILINTTLAIQNIMLNIF